MVVISKARHLKDLCFLHAVRKNLKSLADKAEKESSHDEQVTTRAALEMIDDLINGYRDNTHNQKLIERLNS